MNCSALHTFLDKYNLSLSLTRAQVRLVKFARLRPIPRRMASDALFRQLTRALGGEGDSGPQRLMRALGEETGNLIMAFHRPSFSLPLRGHPTTLPPRIPCGRWSFALTDDSTVSLSLPLRSTVEVVDLGRGVRGFRFSPSRPMIGMFITSEGEGQNDQ